MGYRPWLRTASDVKNLPATPRCEEIRAKGILFLCHVVSQIHPLVINIAMEHGHRNSAFSHELRRVIFHCYVSLPEVAHHTKKYQNYRCHNHVQVRGVQVVQSQKNTKIYQNEIVVCRPRLFFHCSCCLRWLGATGQPHPQPMSDTMLASRNCRCFMQSSV